MIDEVVNLGGTCSYCPTPIPNYALITQLTVEVCTKSSWNTKQLTIILYDSYVIL